VNNYLCIFSNAIPSLILVASNNLCNMPMYSTIVIVANQQQQLLLYDCMPMCPSCSAYIFSIIYKGGGGGGTNIASMFCLCISR